MKFSFTVIGAALAIAAAANANAQVTDVPFYFPVAVGGPITKYIDQFATDFNKENPTIKVSPIYAGSYQDTIVKALTANKAGTPPVASVLLSTDTFTLIDADAIVPIDDFVKTPDDKAWLAGFYKAFLLNGQVSGKTWGVPFQRSTVVLYWNRELFKEAGLDANKPPQTRAEMTAMSQKLTKKDASGKVTQYGVQIPSSGFPYWLFQGLTTQNDVILSNDAGTQTKFDFGVAMLPTGKKRGSPTGGGNFYIFKKATLAQQEAAFKFAKWLTQPERDAQWGMETGYVAVSPAAWDTAVLKKYSAEFPPATVARDQLQYAVAELSTHDNQRVTKALNDSLQAALTGSKTAEVAMKDAQREAAGC